MRSIVITLLCCVAVIQLQAQSKNTKQKKSKVLPVFTVNKKPVTTDEFIYLYKKNHQNNADDFSKEKIVEYLDLFINFKLKVEEARHRGMDTTATFINEYNSYKDELRKPYLPDSKLTDSLVKLTYNRIKEEIHAAHILINLKPEATPEDTLLAYNRITELRNKAVAGEDFGTLAANNSEDPSAKMNKGDLGYFTALQMVYPFETGAYNTPTGQVSSIIRTRFGYHILKVLDRRPARGEVEVSHIMIRTGENKDNEKAKNTIFEVYDQLQAGAKWEELCKQFSEDPGSKDSGGRLRPFGVGAMSSVPSFEAMAFSMKEPGNISDPFQTQYGWHIIRLEKKIPLGTFEEMAPGIKSKVSRDERVQVSKQALQVKLRKDFKLDEKLAVKTKVIALADTTLKTGQWQIPAFPNAEKEVLFTLEGKPYVVKSFFSYVKKNQKPNSLSPEKYLDQLYNSYIDASITQLLEDRLIEKNPEYKMLLNEYYEGILLFEIMEKEVWNKATEDSIGQHKYYDNNVTRYQAKERARAELFSATSKEFIQPLSDLLAKGDSVKLQEFISNQKIKKEAGLFEKEEKPVLAKVTWAPGVYPSENNALFYVVSIKEILLPGPKSFEDARASVISDYQNFLEKEWLNTLRAKYNVKMNEKGKKYILEQLQKK
jgi:peptidyl-prolyl cis-trans isomerase SurA